MKQYKRYLLHVFYILTLGVLLSLPVLAGDLTGSMNIVPTPELESREWKDEDGAVRSERLAAGEYVDRTVGSYGLSLIKKFEGFSETPYYDYGQYSIGYGSNYNVAVSIFPEIAKTGKITQTQATEVLRRMITQPVDASHPSGGFAVWLNNALKSKGIVVNQNQFDALVSFTYNVGSGWWTYTNEEGKWCKVRQMLEDDPSTWTESRAQDAFGSWVNAGGQRLPGLVTRRAEEAKLFCTPVKPNQTTEEQTKETETVSQTLVQVFRDVSEGAWYYNNVMTAYEKGIMKGYGGGVFGPNDKVTRAQMVTALAGFVGESAKAYKGSLDNFRDVPANTWYSQPVNWAYSEGIVSGIGGGMYAPDKDITRQDLCCIIARYLRSIGVKAGNTPTPFVDDGQMSDYARENIYYCASLGIVSGMGNNVFAPLNTATRAELATILVHMCDVVG